MRRWTAIVLALAFLAIGAPSVYAAKSQITVALTGEPPTMDPHRTSNFIGAMVWRWSYDTLLTAERGTGKIGPWLATKWKQISPTAIKFWLRKDANFADGSPVTSEAMKYTLSRVLKATRQRPYFKTFDRIEIIDDKTFIWHNKVPDNGIFNRLTRWAGAISLKSKGKDRATLSRNTFGSGPYILKSWTKGRKMVFEANPNWWGNKDYPKRPKTIILRRIPESATRVKALVTGEVDVIWGVMPQFIPELKKNPETQVVAIPAVRIMHMGFMTKHGGPFTDLKVRQAVNYAIDDAAIRRTILGGRADPIGGMLHPWNFSGYNPKRKWYGYDLAKAKALMKEAGQGDGFKAELIATNGRYPGDKPTCEAIAGMLKKIKINTTCNSQRFPLFKKMHRAYQAGTRKGAAMYYMGFGNGGGESGLVLIGTSACKGAWSGMCYPELDKAITKAVATEEPKAQDKAFDDVIGLMHKLATHKIVAKIHHVFGFRTGLKFRPRHDETLFPWAIEVN